MLKVIATSRGFFKGRLIEPGETFDVDNPKALSKHWMKKLDEPQSGKDTRGAKDGASGSPAKASTDQAI